MGKWTLLSMDSDISPLEGETYGHNVKVKFRLRYQPALTGKFVEAPLLEWNEKIIMIEHHKGETWTFETNMYEHNPTSKTLAIWSRRYLEVYRSAHGEGSLTKGYAKLLTPAGAPVAARALGPSTSDARKQADAVRAYLKRHESILEIQVHDIPSINRPAGEDKNTHKERLLLFNVGVRGGGRTLQMEQYLNVDGSRAASDWTRECVVGWPRGALATAGIREVAAPALVSNKRAAAFVSGECW